MTRISKARPVEAQPVGKAGVGWLSFLEKSGKVARWVDAVLAVVFAGLWVVTGLWFLAALALLCTLTALVSPVERGVSLVRARFIRRR